MKRVSRFWCLVLLYLVVVAAVFSCWQPRRSAGEEVTLTTPKGERVVLEVSLKAPAAEPETLWLKAPWKSDDVPPEFHRTHFGPWQWWSIFADHGMEPGVVWGAEVKTKDEHFWTGKPFESDFRLDAFKTRMAAFIPTARPTWLLVDAEEPRTEYTWTVVNFLRANYPDVELGGGPAAWAGPISQDLRRYDFLVQFRNPGMSGRRKYWARMGEDFAGDTARLDGFGMPYRIGPQPVAKGGKGESTYVELVDAEEYERAIEICRRSPRGVLMWGVPDFLGLEQTEDWERVLAAWDAADYDACEKPRLYVAPQEEWRVEASMCRVAHHAGFRPVVDWTLDAEANSWVFYSYAGGRGSWVVVIAPPALEFNGGAIEWGYILTVWADTGHPWRARFTDAVLREAVRNHEIKMGAMLAEKLE